MNTPMYKNSRVYVYQNNEEMQADINEFLSRRAEKMKIWMDRIVMAFAWILAILLGVGVLPVFLNAIVRGK